LARRSSARCLLAVTVVMAALVSGCGGGASPSPTSAPATPRAALAAGEYTTGAFSPAITYALPDGWLVAGDGATYFALQPVATDAFGIHVFRSPLPASQDAACPIAAVPDVGATASELMDWIVARPGLAAGEPASVTLGGLFGRQVDLAIVEGWAASCPFANGLPTVPLFVSAADPTFRWVIAGSERLRLTILDVPGKGTIVIDIDDFDGSLMDGYLSAASTIVESMRFALS
jgi:hypothetical protein